MKAKAHIIYHRANGRRNAEFRSAINSRVAFIYALHRAAAKNATITIKYYN